MCEGTVKEATTDLGEGTDRARDWCLASPVANLVASCNVGPDSGLRPLPTGTEPHNSSRATEALAREVRQRTLRVDVDLLLLLYILARIIASDCCAMRTGSSSMAISEHCFLTTDHQ